MNTLRSPYRLSKTLFALAACLLLSAGVSQAATIYWTDWTSTTVGTPSGGSALGTMSGLGVNVSYSGEVFGPRGDGVTPSWNPAGTFSGGFVGNAPLASYGSIPLGNGGVVDTITFSRPVVDPVMAIWSLGGLYGLSASFNFQTTAPITLESGGPSAEFGGSSISVSGDTVSGNEGNGTIEFHGTFSQISWTSTYEPTYNFTIGAPTVVPEPTFPCLMLLGLVVYGWFRPWQAAQRKPSVEARRA